jgi:ferric iron reductase protein FhuF
MIADFAASVPASLDAYRNSVVTDPGSPSAVPLTALQDEAVFDATLATFAAGYGPADRRAVVSYWSQHYFALLATPALTALMRLRQPLPLAFDATRLELDGSGKPARLLVCEGTPACAAGLAGLIDGHLNPFVKLCHARCGIAPRVLWGNAATIFDYVAGELRGDGAACEEVATCLGWRAGTGCDRTPLAQALCPDASGCRRRRACCLRHRLPGVPSCGSLCPLESPIERCPVPC